MEYSSTRQKRLRQLRRAVAAFCHRCAHSAFGSWLVFIDEQFELRRVMSKAVGALSAQTRSMRVAFNTWMHARAALCILKHGAATAIAASLRDALNTWREASTATRTSDQLGARAVQGAVKHSTAQVKADEVAGEIEPATAHAGLSVTERAKAKWAHVKNLTTVERAIKVAQEAAAIRRKIVLTDFSTALAKAQLDQFVHRFAERGITDEAAMIAQRRSFAGKDTISPKELEAECLEFRGVGSNTECDTRFPAAPAGENFLRALITFCRELLEKKGKTAESLARNAPQTAVQRKGIFANIHHSPEQLPARRPISTPDASPRILMPTSVTPQKCSSALPGDHLTTASTPQGQSPDHGLPSMSGPPSRDVAFEFPPASEPCGFVGTIRFGAAYDAHFDSRPSG